MPISTCFAMLCCTIIALKFSCIFMQRGYNVSLPHNKIPEALCEMAKELAAPAMPPGEDFRPEAAIVNYFALGTFDTEDMPINTLSFIYASPGSTDFHT